MRILVEIAGWEQGCCGKAFAIGATATWQVVRADPDNGPVPRFVEEHHGQTSPDVPRLAVSGTVRAIREVRQHPRSVLPPLAGELTEFDRTEHDVTAVRDRGNGGVAGYRVELDVPDDAALPHFVADAAALAGADRRRREAATIAEAMQDELGARMRAVLLTSVARVTRNENGSIAAIEPTNAEAAALSWRRGENALQLQAGGGRFTVRTAAELDRMVTAVQAGHIREEVGDTWLRTVIERTNAADLIAEERISAYEGSGFRALGGRTSARIRRGSFRYAAW